MTMDGSIDSCHQAKEVPLRVLVAVHGHEPPEWVIRACRVVSGWKSAKVRVLGVVDVPNPPFTSVIPPARLLYAAARRAWRDDEEQRVQSAVDRVTRTFTHKVEVACRQSSPRGVADTIVDHALGWAADVIVVAVVPTPMSRSWWCQGPVHERLLRHGTAAVLAIPAAPESSRTGRIIPLARAIPGGIRPVPAGQSV